MKKSILITIIFLSANLAIEAQLKFGADLYSRYIWRGINLGGDSPSLQPGLSYTTGGLCVGFWGAYSYPTDGFTYSENDIYASYSLTVENKGSFTVIATDYYLPSSHIPLGHYEKNGGAHVIEAGLSYSGPQTFPLSLAGYYNLHNDVDNSVYLQIGYPFEIDDAVLSLSLGFVPGKSTYYLTEKAAIINASVTASKPIVVTEKFTVPINVSYTVNPNQDISYLTFGAGFTF
ncbi:MAG: hypothetical protein C4539_02060 [Ignavibacteriales bacterium]|nr:MAG: hypothetical protein C4539_02060 [Ignavibacteriales bacterium]